MWKAVGVWVEIDQYLEEQHPEQFRAIQEKYDGPLKVIEQKIKELEGMGQNLRHDGEVGDVDRSGRSYAAARIPINGRNRC
jgi:hypothetical protein